MKILRLLVTDECHRRCRGCCNKQWDLAELPVAWRYSGFDQIILTGGEPMLSPEHVLDIIAEIRHQTAAHVFVYTAKVDNAHAAQRVLVASDGLTVTLHGPADVPAFLVFNRWACTDDRRRSLRLNMFRGVTLPRATDLRRWSVRSGIAWLPDCPLPPGEVFMRHRDVVRKSDG